jgi:hypothetical protein
MKNDSEIIDELGGTSAVAKLCEIKPSSVSEWRQSGIPKGRRKYFQLLRPDLFQSPSNEAFETKQEGVA